MGVSCGCVIDLREINPAAEICCLIYAAIVHEHASGGDEAK